MDEPEARPKVAEALDNDGLTVCPWGDRGPAFILNCEAEACLRSGVGERCGEIQAAVLLVGRRPLYREPCETDFRNRVPETCYSQ